MSKEVLNQLGPVLGDAEMGGNPADYLVPHGVPLTSDCVLLHIVVEQLVDLESGCMPEEEDLGLLLVGLESPAGDTFRVTHVICSE